MPDSLAPSLHRPAGRTALIASGAGLPDPPFEQLEGDEVDGVTVAGFPSFEIAKAWYDSPAYRAISHHRENGARYIGLLVEGGAMPPELRMPHTKDRRGATT